jgi:hypothetical protein
VHADHLADSTSGFRAGIDRGANSGDIAAQRDRHEARAHLVLLDELDVSGLERRIARFDRGDQTLGLDQTIASPFAIN